MKYLYGTSVQGIQSFIFQTNTLRDIIGASELVDAVCNDKFNDYKGNGEVLLHAAGNIKCIYNTEEECKKTVRDFPKKISQFAPGITISQAVVAFDETCDFAEVVNELERKLHIQRNRPMRSQTLGSIGIQRSRSTGLPSVDEKGNDAAELAKQQNYNRKKLCALCFGEECPDKNFPYNIEDITQQNDWVAIMHIDGNGLGQVVQKVGHKREVFSKFSEELNMATIRSAQETYTDCKKKYVWTGVVPIRPVVLGGDDLTVICRGDIALYYAEQFMHHFEENTKQMGSLQGENISGLTACAGIAFVKSSFPFYYGYQLAEELCKYAKQEAKKINEDSAPSCLMFHKMQDAFSEKYEDIRKRELRPQPNVSFCFGPYYLSEQKEKWTIEHLSAISNTLKDTEKKDEKSANATKSHLRQWLTAMHDSEGKAQQVAKRAWEMAANSTLKDLIRETTNMEQNLPSDGQDKVYPVYDILAVHTIQEQTTK